MNIEDDVFGDQNWKMNALIILIFYSFLFAQSFFHSCLMLEKWKLKNLLKWFPKNVCERSTIKSVKQEKHEIEKEILFKHVF